MSIADEDGIRLPFWRGFMLGAAIVLLPRAAVKDRLRSMFSGVTASMSEELIAERRAAATEESDG